MELICVNDFISFLNLKDDWNNLLSQSTSDNLFLRHEWLSNWWSSYNNKNKSALMALLLKKDGRLIGAAPLMLSKDKMRGLPIKKIAFMGESSWTTGDFLTAEQKEEALEKIIEYILGIKWDMMDLQNVPEESENIRIMAEILKKKGIGHLSMPASSSPYLIADASWDSFYNQRSIRFKKAMRNKINKINKSGAVKIQKYSTPEEVKRVLPIIFEIGLKGWKHKINNAISSTEENKRFYTQLSETMSSLGWLNIWLLSLNEKPIAFEYHIRHKNTIHGLIADYDEDYRELSPGSILDFNIMQHIFNNEKCEYDLGSGNSFYKMNWTEKAKRYQSHYFYNNTFNGKSLIFIEKRIVPVLKLLRNKVKQASI